MLFHAYKQKAAGASEQRTCTSCARQTGELLPWVTSD